VRSFTLAVKADNSVVLGVQPPLATRYVLWPLKYSKNAGNMCLITANVVLVPVAAPALQRSQVISRSEHPRARSPGCTFFLKKVDGRQRRWDCFTVKI